MAPDRSQLIPPEVMVAPLIWLCSNGSNGINGQRFIAMRWDESLPPAEAAKKAGAPAAWQQLGRQAIMPERMR
jgi:3-oxoacyl-[acyl-carrier protein] reductase